MNKQVIEIRIKKDGSYTLQAKEGFGFNEDFTISKISSEKHMMKLEDGNKNGLRTKDHRVRHQGSGVRQHSGIQCERHNRRKAKKLYADYGDEKPHRRNRRGNQAGNQ